MSDPVLVRKRIKEVCSEAQDGLAGETKKDKVLLSTRNLNLKMTARKKVNEQVRRTIRSPASACESHKS